jgi:hypothetical protein
MKRISQKVLISKKNYADSEFCIMIRTLTAERQKPRSAKNEALEGVSKVGVNNPVRQHITLYVLLIQDCSAIHQPYNTLARDGYNNGNVLRRGATAFNSRKPMGRTSSGLELKNSQTLVKLASSIGAPSEVYKLTAISAHCVSASVKRLSRSVLGYIGQLLL